MRHQESEPVVRRFFDELWNAGDLDTVGELVGAEHVHHLGDEELHGPDGVVGIVIWLRTAFPDLRFEIDDLLSSPDRVVVRWTASGTHQGQLDDLAATGRHATWSGTDWFRLADGKIVEAWVFVDGSVLHDQLEDG